MPTFLKLLIFPHFSCYKFVPNFIFSSLFRICNITAMAECLKYFEIIEGSKQRRCIVKKEDDPTQECGKEIAYNGTSGFIRHLSKIHGININDKKRQLTSTTSSASSSKQLKKDDQHHQSISGSGSEATETEAVIAVDQTNMSYTINSLEPVAFQPNRSSPLSRNVRCLQEIMAIMATIDLEDITKDEMPLLQRMLNDARSLKKLRKFSWDPTGSLMFLIILLILVYPFYSSKIRRNTQKQLDNNTPGNQQRINQWIHSI